jgi:hypothetical protein
MKQIPQPTKVRYDVLLAQHHIPATLQPYYLKWVRYYVDFCQKYRFEESEKKSLPHFISKLKEKKQTDQQQNQAFDAVSIFFELEPVKNVRETNPFYEQKPQLTHSSWVTVYNDLKSEIKFIPFQTCH